MSFPSCIKIPSKNNLAPESTSRNGASKDYVPYEKLLSIANLVFGQGRWSHAITSQTVDFVEYVMGKYQIGCAAFVRVQLADGTFHEDMGYSNTESGVKGSAIQTARHLSIAVALKKALLCFGGIIEEKINENIALSNETKHENNKARQDKSKDLATTKIDKIGRENSSKECKIAESIVTAVEESLPVKKTSGKCVKTYSTPKRNDSPKPIETSDDIPIASDAEAIIAEFQDSENVIDDRSILPIKDLPSVSMSEDEIRLERKRKQKQKQEEYKKQMKEKLLKTDDKPNPRF